MVEIAGKDVTLWKAAADAGNSVYVAVTVDALVERELRHSMFVNLTNGQWYGAGQARWATAAICFVSDPSRRMVAVSEDGDVMTYIDANSTRESIAPQPRSLRALSTIAGRAYACGGRREVFVRIGEGQWQAISAPAPPPGQPAGFESIAGLSDDNIYAVGWRGEIWQRINNTWVQRDSPVNLILTGVTCAETGLVYACGQNGTLVKGQDDQWEVIDHDQPPQDFWDIHAFGDRIFVASLANLFEIKDDDLVPVDFGDDPPGTCHRLTSAGGVLWSVGAQDVFSFDGSAWQRIV
jgi:hypothetical protein